MSNLLKRALAKKNRPATSRAATDTPLTAVEFRYTLLHESAAFVDTNGNLSDSDTPGAPYFVPVK